MNAYKSTNLFAYPIIINLFLHIVVVFVCFSLICLIFVFLDCFSQGGLTALKLATFKGQRDVVALLLDRGANTDATNNVIRRVLLSNYLKCFGTITI